MGIPGTCIGSSTSSSTSASLTLRPLSSELGCLQNCDGSAEFKAGNTAVLAAIHGPTAPRNVAVQTATSSHPQETNGCTVSVLIRSGELSSGNNSSNSSEREWEEWLRQQLVSAVIVTEHYPRCTVSIILHILTADGSVLAACWHATMLALMDAGVDMRNMFVAVTVASIRSGSSNDNDAEEKSENNQQQQQQQQRSLQTDPNADEEQQADVVTVAVLDCHCNQRLLACRTTCTRQTTTTTTTTTSCSTAQLLAILTAATRAVPALHAFIRMAIEQKTTRESKTLWSFTDGL